MIDGRVAALKAEYEAASPKQSALSNAADRAAITRELQRTVTDKEDQQLTFGWMGSGVYSAPARLAPGLWEVEIDGKGNGVADYHKIFRFVVKAE